MVPWSLKSNNSNTVRFASIETHLGSEMIPRLWGGKSAEFERHLQQLSTFSGRMGPRGQDTPQANSSVGDNRRKVTRWLMFFRSVLLFCSLRHSFVRHHKWSVNCHETCVWTWICEYSFHQSYARKGLELRVRRVRLDGAMIDRGTPTDWRSFWQNIRRRLQSTGVHVMIQKTSLGLCLTK
jgi:hypothetical protein